MSTKKQKIVPQLRFPEFEKDGRWKKVFFSNLFKIGSGRDYKHLDKGKVPVYGTGGYMLSVNNYLYEGKSACIGRKGTINKPIFLTGKFWTVDTLFYTHSYEDCSPEFIYLLFQNINWLRYNEAGGVPSLSKAIIYKIEVFVPEQQEQQKIAHCLSSLDDLITAETEKLAHLKDHKKGLLQQLFPAHGKTKPQYRFPEFKNDGDWESEPLGNIGKPLMCKRIFKEQTSDNSNNAIPFFKIGTFGGEPDAFIPIDLYNDFKSKYSFPNIGDILISASGTIGRLVVYDGSNAYFQDSNIVWIGNDETQITNSLLFYSYSTLVWQTSDGGVIKRLYNSNLKEMEICFPNNKKEQQKIADCLSSADNLIATQEQKIEHLKDHKKGLMQQLFPNVNELAV